MSVSACVRVLLAAALLLPSAAAAAGFEIVPIALTGDVAPDVGGATYDYLGSSFISPVVSDHGIVGFQVSFVGSPAGRALFLATPQAGVLVALEGSPVNGLGGTFTFMPNDGGITFDDSNRLVFEAAVSGLGSTGLAAGPGLVTPLVAPGDPLPAPANSVDYIASIARREDTLLFEAGTNGASVGLFHRKDGVASKIVLWGETVPGHPSEDFEFLVEGTRIAGPDSAGRIAFKNYNGNSGVFLWSEGTGVVTVAYTGDPAPGTGANLSSFGAPQLNDAGLMVFGGLLDDPGGTLGIFRYDGTAIVPLVLGGQVAPGTGGRTYHVPQAPVLDDTGAIVFFAELRDGPDPAGEGIFRLAEGLAQPVVLTGEVAPGTGGATYTELSMTFTPEGALSPSGRFLAFQSVLSDGRSGIFRGSLTANVPSLPPGGLVALGLALAAAARLALRRARWAPATDGRATRSAGAVNRARRPPPRCAPRRRRSPWP